MSFEVNNISDVTEIEIELPRIFYLGYVLVDQNNNKIKLYNNSNGFLGAKISHDGIYLLTYSGTILDKISRIICFLGIIWIIFMIVKMIRRYINDKKL